MINGSKPHSILAIGLPTALWAQSARGHDLIGDAYGLLTGFLHPISGVDHVLAMVAVGLQGAQLGAGTVVAAVGIFLLWKAIA
jgi:urease accessory protein